MPYNSEVHNRRSIRLKGYDYTQAGAYFVTICTKEKQCLFGDVVQGEMRLNSLGAIAFNTWNQIPENYPHVELDYFIIMPNHVHGILIFVNHPLISNVNSQQSFIKIAQSLSSQELQIRPKGNVSKSLSAVVGWYKSSVAKIINQICNNSGKGLIWQRNYYEHIIRHERALNQIRNYILNNPQNWTDDPQYSQFDPIQSKPLIEIPF